MNESVRSVGRFFLRPLAGKLLGRPVGVWIAWVTLGYAAYVLGPRLGMFLAHPVALARPLSDVIVTWPIFIAAVAALAARRQIAFALCSIICVCLLVHTIYHSDWIGSALCIVTPLGLFANRRWYYERLPNVLK